MNKLVRELGSFVVAILILEIPAFFALSIVFCIIFSGAWALGIFFSAIAIIIELFEIQAHISDHVKNKV